MQRVEPLTGKAEKDFAKMTEEFVARPMKPIGHCEDCKKPLAPGAIHYAIKWDVEDRGGMKVQIPSQYLCHDCGLARKEGSPSRRKPARAASQEPVTAVEEAVEALTPKEIALRLLKATGSEPHGSKWLAAQAGLEYGDYVLAILRKLRDAGRLRLEEGKWLRA